MAFKSLTGFDASSQRIISVADPSSSTDAATKAYVDNSLLGLRWKDPVRVATTANITLSGTQTIDTIGVTAGQRVLVKNQSTASQNGIYVVAAGAWTRSTDADTAAKLNSATVMVAEGAVNGDKSFTQTAEVVTLDTDAVTWVQFNGGGTTYTAGAGLTESPAGTFNVGAGNGITVNADDVALASSTAGAGLTYTTGVLAVGAGTGITVSADDVAINTSVVARKFSQAIGNGSNTSIAITHNLGTRAIVWQLYDGSTFADVVCDAVRTDTNTLTLTFAVAPATNAYTVAIVG